MKKSIFIISSLICVTFIHTADTPPALSLPISNVTHDPEHMLTNALLQREPSRLRKYIHSLDVDNASQLLKVADQRKENTVVTSCAKMLAAHLHVIKEFDTLPDHLQKAVLVPHVNTTLRKLYGTQQMGTEFTLETDAAVRLAEYNQESILAFTAHKVWQKKLDLDEGFKIVYTSAYTPIISAHTTKHPDTLLIGTRRHIFEYDMVTNDCEVVYEAGYEYSPSKDIDGVSYDKEQNKLLLITGHRKYRKKRDNGIIVDLSTDQSKYVYWATSSIGSIKHNRDWSKILTTECSYVSVQDVSSGAREASYIKGGDFTHAIASDQDMNKLFIASRGAPHIGIIIYDTRTEKDTYIITPNCAYIKALQPNEDGSEMLLENDNQLMTYDIESNEIQTAYSLPKNRSILWAGYIKSDNEVHVVSRSSESFTKLYFTSLLLSPFLPQLETMNLEQLRLLFKASACWKEQQSYKITAPKEFLIYQDLPKELQIPELFSISTSCIIA